MADNVIQMPRSRAADPQSVKNLAVGIIQYLQAGADGNRVLAIAALSFATAAAFQAAGIPREVMME